MPEPIAGNHYLVQSSDSGITYVNDIISLSGTATTLGDHNVSWSVKKVADGRITPELYFKYIKKKFGTLEEMRLNSRLKKVERAFNKAVESGQEALGQKLLIEIARETRESEMYAKGIRHFIEREDLIKYKTKIRKGHISDTLLKNYVRAIPEEVTKKRQKYDDVFDDFVVFHYYEEEAEKKRAEKQKLSQREKDALRDPVLFGIIKETNRLYFIAEWDDELCDLSFDEMIDAIGKDDSEHEITRDPKLNV